MMGSYPTPATAPPVTPITPEKLQVQDYELIETRKAPLGDPGYNVR